MKVWLYFQLHHPQMKLARVEMLRKSFAARGIHLYNTYRVPSINTKVVMEKLCMSLRVCQVRPFNKLLTLFLQIIEAPISYYCVIRSKLHLHWTEKSCRFYMLRWRLKTKTCCHYLQQTVTVSKSHHTTFHSTYFLMVLFTIITQVKLLRGH